MLSKLPELEEILPSDNIIAILYVAGYVVRLLMILKILTFIMKNMEILLMMLTMVA